MVRRSISATLCAVSNEVIDPSSNWAAMLACAAKPELRFVVSNTTEAGIAYVEEELAHDIAPKSFPAKLAVLLWTRYQKLGPAAPGLIVLPCELLEQNGAKLRRYVLQHATDWSLPPEFLAWVEQQNYFLNTLVDRIVPGFPSADAEALQAQLGYSDAMMVAAEPFHLWVIEGPAALEEELPLAKAGLKVLWTDDLQPFRGSKVRVLNGAHTASALAAFGAGIDTVKGMMDDALFARYLNTLVFDEIVPFVPLAEDERKRYAASILERFENPHIRHELISISLNSVSKWQVRVLPTVKDHVRSSGKAPRLLAFSLAALLAFYHGQSGEGAYTGERNGQPYPIKDNAEVLAIMAEAWRNWQPGSDVGLLVKHLLGDERLWGEDLTVLGDLAAQVTAALGRIKAEGVRAALTGLL
ncbi:MAG: tagaturonate reductase [Rhodocyclaceae bacterium]